MPTPEPNPTVPKAFISYSWDDSAHKEWVKQLATRLRENGVDVTLDRWRTAPGDRITAFMEQAVRENDIVIAVCTPLFKERSDGRVGGVGYEGDIMTAYAFTGGDERKFIPVLRSGSWSEAAPTWLLGRAKIDLSGDPYSESEYMELLETLYNAREKEPPLGPPPNFEDKVVTQVNLAPSPVTPLVGSSTPQTQSTFSPIWTGASGTAAAWPLSGPKLPKNDGLNFGSGHFRAIVELTDRLERMIGRGPSACVMTALIGIALSAFWVAVAHWTGLKSQTNYAFILLDFSITLLLGSIVFGLLIAFVLSAPVWNEMLACSLIAGLVATFVGGLAYGNDWIGRAFEHKEDLVRFRILHITPDPQVRLVRMLVFGMAVAFVYGIIFALKRADLRRVPRRSRLQLRILSWVALVAVLAVVSWLSQNIIEFQLGRGLLGGSSIQGDVPYQVLVLTVGIYITIMIAYANWLDSRPGSPPDRMLSRTVLGRRVLVSATVVLASGLVLAGFFLGKPLFDPSTGAAFARTVLGLFFLIFWSTGLFHLFTGHHYFLSKIDNSSKLPRFGD